MKHRGQLTARGVPCSDMAGDEDIRKREVARTTLPPGPIGRGMTSSRSSRRRSAAGVCFSVSVSESGGFSLATECVASRGPDPLQGRLPRTFRGGDAELSADRSHGSSRNLAMSWHRSATICARSRDSRPRGGARIRGRSVPLEVTPLQAAVSSIVTSSTWPAPTGGSRPSSRYRASVRSRPAGTSATRPPTTTPRTTARR